MGVAPVLTASDCRRKAAECIRSAEAAADRKTREGFCRTAQAWAMLAQQVERDVLQPPSPTPIKRPVDLLRRITRPADAIDAADVLRQRLRLTDADEDPSEPTSDN
jgi:hypothetical protein